MTMENSKQSIILTEILNLREEMAQLREIVSKNRLKKPSSSKETVKRRNRDYKIGTSRNTPHFVFEIRSDGLNEKTKTYLNDIFNVQIHPILQGINHNLSKTFNQLGESFSDLEQEKSRIKTDIHNAMKDIALHRNIVKLKFKHQNIQNDAPNNSVSTISDEEIDDFTKNIPEIMKALAHENKIKLLRTLRTSDYSQGELAEITGIRGGTFKNHMDALLEINFVQQSEVRGNYFITTLGVEALSYAEMLYKRSKSYTWYESSEILSEGDNS